MSASLSVLPVFFTAVGVGLVCLLLVASELGKRARLSLPGRIALMGALGFGVFAFSLKTGIILYLDSLERTDLVVTRPQKVVVQLPSAPKHILAETKLSGSRSWPIWRSLPSRAPVPSDNPQSPQKITLGKKLFFDPNLSVDRTVSCASCHRLEQGGDDNARVSSGIRQLKGDRNAPSVINANASPK